MRKLSSSEKKNILIYTDGACSGNPGPGGYGTVIVLPHGEVIELGGGARSTTNNQMEMTAVLKGLESLHKVDGPLWVLTDSTYVIRGLTQWIFGWKKRGWKTADGKDVSNQSLWMDLDKEFQKRKKLGKVEFKYVPGHAGVPGNERCDQIGVMYSKGETPNLYSGPLSQYSHDVFSVPNSLDLPEQKKSSGKSKKPISYLSYVNGSLERHGSWSECEARVKGRPGAKFKKAFSKDEEVEIAKGWGASNQELSKL